MFKATCPTCGFNGEMEVIEFESIEAEFSLSYNTVRIPVITACPKCGISSAGKVYYNFHSFEIDNIYSLTSN